MSGHKPWRVISEKMRTEPERREQEIAKELSRDHLKKNELRG